MKIESQLYSLANLVRQSPDWRFSIPRYQRLYVWGEDQVLTLLNDLVNAYERKLAHPDELGANLFFLGGTLLVEQEAGSRCFDLIDGQQRFTTLWLLCRAWRGALEPFLQARAAGHGEGPRLRFAIRPEVNRFLESLAFDRVPTTPTDDKATGRLQMALDWMESLFAKRDLPAAVPSRESFLAGLTEFVFHDVRFVITTVPRETDLNKLFEVINNRGVQLQHHEILKARMLETLDETERDVYAALWEACADMDAFVERNLEGRARFSIPEITALYEGRTMESGAAMAAELRVRMRDRKESDSLTLEAILDSAQPPPPKAKDETSDDAGSTGGVRSIFGFPLFLEHALRVWLFERGRGDLPRLLDRDLLSLFEAHFFGGMDDRAAAVRSFIETLWELRLLFDRHIIKWVDQGDVTVHLISGIRVSVNDGNRYMSRQRVAEGDQGFTLLQSMLYHAQEITTQYWVTALLCFMHRHREDTHHGHDRYYDYLRHLDNHLLDSAADTSLIERTRAFMQEPWHRRKSVHSIELSKDSGVGFAHYWFYKLEFVLWFQKKHTIEAWEKFRFTAKSSVEHIAPQNPTDPVGERVSEAMLHSFGNLALVTSSLNSEYSNRPYAVKRSQFLHKNRDRVDSLKMWLIYKHERWGDEEARAHRAEMIECMDVYHRETPRGPNPPDSLHQ